MTTGNDSGGRQTWWTTCSECLLPRATRKNANVVDLRCPQCESVTRHRRVPMTGDLKNEWREQWNETARTAGVEALPFMARESLDLMRSLVELQEWEG